MEIERLNYFHSVHFGMVDANNSAYSRGGAWLGKLDTTDKSSRHAPPCRPLVSHYWVYLWTAHGMCLLL